MMPAAHHWLSLLAPAIALLVTVSAQPAEAARRPSQKYWEVSWRPDESTQLRLGPSRLERSLQALPAGTLLKDLGCIGEGAERWCRVQLADESARRGWVPASSLEAAAGNGSRVPGSTSLIETLRYDATGTVRCSAPDDAVDATCAFRLVRDEAGATFLLANPAQEIKAPLRVVRVEHDSFSTRDGSLIWASRIAGGWLVAVDGNEYYVIGSELIEGRTRRSTATASRAGGAFGRN